MKEKTLLKATLCFLVEDNEVVLAIKAKHIGKGLWNGYGGGMQTGETPEAAALRELYEEASVTALLWDLEKVAIINFHNTKSNKSHFVCQVHVYFVKKWTGTPRETEEMGEPMRFPIDKLPLKQMMLADKIWLPIVLAGKKILAEAYYGPFQKELLQEVKVREVVYLY